MTSTLPTLPDSEVAVAAHRFVASVSPSVVTNHAVRSYLFARAGAAAKGLRADVDYDDELVYLSCVLHDLGLTDHANGEQRFEVDGADAAARFLREQGVDEQRITTVWQAIALHTSVGIAHRFGPVAAVAHLGISTDVVGVDRELLDPAFIDQVHTQWPRLQLGVALADVIAEQVEQNPQKGPPLTFPRLLHTMVTGGPAPTFFDLVDGAGWGDTAS